MMQTPNIRSDLTWSTFLLVDVQLYQLYVDAMYAKKPDVKLMNGVCPVICVPIEGFEPFLYGLRQDFSLYMLVKPLLFPEWAQ